MCGERSHWRSPLGWMVVILLPVLPVNTRTIQCVCAHQLQNIQTHSLPKASVRMCATKLQSCTRIFPKILSPDSYDTDSLVVNICCALDFAEVWQTRTHRDKHLTWVRSPQILLSSSALSQFRSKSCLCDVTVCSVVS